jgi:hypothetical protein
MMDPAPMKVGLTVLVVGRGPGVVLLVKVVVHYCWGGFFVCAMPHPFYPEIPLFQNEN